MTSMNALSSPRSTYSVLGNICKNPHLLRESEVHLSDKDFDQEFHKVAFSAINNIAYSGAEATKINEIDIDNYLSAYPKLYKIWEKHNGLSYIRDCMSHANEKTFMSNYKRLKKFSLLRFYIQNGIDISDLFDYKSMDLNEQESGMKTIDKMDIQEIIDHYTMKIINIRDDFDIGQESKDFKAGDELDELLDKLNTEPEMGYPFRNGFYNAVFRGMRRHKFMLRSAGTGGGKTRLALADICNVACDTIYDYDKGWVSNGPAYPSLFISTEIEKEELQTIMLVFITGIDDTIIKDGKYSQPVLERLQKGIEVLKRAPIYCVYVDDFSVSDIEMIIEKHIITYGVSEVAFDYIQMTPKLSRSMAKSFGSNLREDQILVQFSAAMKNLANKYNIYLTTSTQLNRSAKEIENRDTTALRGGSATADKVDHGLMTFRATAKDHDNLKHILEQGFHDKPNYSHWVYKNRSGINNLIIWSTMNLGTMREDPLFVTDIDFNLLDINPLDISFEDVQFKVGDEVVNDETTTDEIVETQENIQADQLDF